MLELSIPCEKHSNNLRNKQLRVRQTECINKEFNLCYCVTKGDAQSVNGCLFLAISRETKEVALEGMNCKRSTVC